MFGAIMKRMPDMRPAGPWEYRHPPIAPSVVGPAHVPVTFTPGPKVRA